MVTRIVCIEMEHSDILLCRFIRMLNSMNFTDGDDVKTDII